MKQKCLGLPDLDDPSSMKRIIPCDKEVEKGEDWCKECGEEMMRRFVANLKYFEELDKQ